MVNNGKQTPSGLSQHLSLVGTCASCGAQQHQLMANMATHIQQTSFALGTTDQSVIRSNNSLHARSNMGTSSNKLTTTCSIQADSIRSTKGCPSSNNKSTNFNREDDHGGSSELSRKSPRGQSFAKIVHHTRAGQVNRCLSSDQQEHFRAGLDHCSADPCLNGSSQACHGHQQRFAKSACKVNDTNEIMTTTTAAAAATSISSDKRKPDTSLLAKINASSSNNMNESISSFGVNDSGPTTSQENTPHIEANGGHGRRHRLSSQLDFNYSFNGAERESDSVLWNQSVHSIDYCSDCCLSYCGYCSCQSNGPDDFPTLDHAGSQSILCSGVQSNPDTVRADKGHSSHNKLARDAFQVTSSSLDLTQCSTSYLVHDDRSNVDATQNTKICRRKSDQPWKSFRSSIDDSPRGQASYSSKNDRTNPRSSSKKSQTMEMRTIGIFSSSGQVSTNDIQSVDSSREAQKVSCQDDDKLASPIAFALHSAASSALGACTIEAEISSSGDNRRLDDSDRFFSTTKQQQHQHDIGQNSGDQEDDSDDDDESGQFVYTGPKNHRSKTVRRSPASYQSSQRGSTRSARSRRSSRKIKSCESKGAKYEAFEHDGDNEEHKNDTVDYYNDDDDDDYYDDDRDESVSFGAPAKPRKNQKTISSDNSTTLINRPTNTMGSTKRDSNNELGGQIDDLGVNQVALVALTVSRDSTTNANVRGTTTATATTSSSQKTKPKNNS